MLHGVRRRITRRRAEDAGKGPSLSSPEQKAPVLKSHARRAPRHQAPRESRRNTPRHRRCVRRHLKPSTILAQAGFLSPPHPQILLRSPHSNQGDLQASAELLLPAPTPQVHSARPQASGHAHFPNPGPAGKHHVLDQMSASFSKKGPGSIFQPAATLSLSPPLGTKVGPDAELTGADTSQTPSAGLPVRGALPYSLLGSHLLRVPPRNRLLRAPPR